MSAAQTATHNPAKAVQYVCRLLRSYGVGPKQLSPELVRQAKLLDAPLVSARTSWVHKPSHTHLLTHLLFLQACQPLLAACHDLALLVLAGFPPCCAEALAQLKQQLHQKALLLLQDDAGAALKQQQWSQPVCRLCGESAVRPCGSQKQAGNRKEPGCLSGLVALLSSPSVDMQVAAAGVLRISAFEDRHRRHRQAVASEHGCLSALVVLLGSPSEKVQEAAAEFVCCATLQVGTTMCAHHSIAAQLLLE